MTDDQRRRWLRRLSDWIAGWGMPRLWDALYLIVQAILHKLGRR